MPLLHGTAREYLAEGGNSHEDSRSVRRGGGTRDAGWSNAGNADPGAGERATGGVPERAAGRGGRSGDDPPAGRAGAAGRGADRLAAGGSGGGRVRGRS